MSSQQYVTQVQAARQRLAEGTAREGDDLLCYLWEILGSALQAKMDLEHQVATLKAELDEARMTLANKVHELEITASRLALAGTFTGTHTGLH